MFKKIKCQSVGSRDDVRVKIIKAPLVDSKILKLIVWERERALVLSSR